MKTFIYIDQDRDFLKFGTLLDLYRDEGDYGVFVLHDRSNFEYIILYYWQVIEESLKDTEEFDKKVKDNQDFREKVKNGEIWAVA